MKLPKLPIGIQTFSEIRDKKENYLYIDKMGVLCIIQQLVMIC